MIKLSRPYIPTESVKAVTDTLLSGNLVQGERVSAFESALSNYLSIPEVIVVSSGTAALYLSLIAQNIGSGDEVIVPAYSFPAVANVIELTGAQPVFVDISLRDCCINPVLIEKKISRRTAAILPVHEFGHPADMSTINRLAQEHGLIVIEDAACALGTLYKGKAAGTLSDAGCFSFHPRKILTTGEGGAVVTRSSSLAAKIRKLRNHGIQTNGGKIEFVIPGYNFRMTDFQAAMGIDQLTQLNETIQIFREQAMCYSKLLSKSHAIACESNSSNASTYQTYQVLLPGKLNVEQVKADLYKHGIETNIGAYAIPLQPYYNNKYSTDNREYPEAGKAWKQGLALPIGRHITSEDQEYIVKQLLTLLNDYGF